MNTPKFPCAHLVEVDWVDSASRGRWDTLEVYQKEVTACCRSVGYLILKNARIVILLQTQSINTINNALDAITIPRGCFTRIRKLK